MKEPSKSQITKTELGIEFIAKAFKETERHIIELLARGITNSTDLGEKEHQQLEILKRVKEKY